jgi:thiamine pyrophosphate-dependent acetolactate synthase large subunit-like protein
MRNWYIKRHVNRLFSDVTNLSKNKRQQNNGSPRSSSDIAKTTALILSSERPLLIIGSGAMKDVDKIPDFALAIESLGIPVFLGGMARGLLGRKSDVQYFHKRTKALKESDCILLAGIPVDFRLNYGGHFNRKAKIIAISKNISDLRKNFKANIAILEYPAKYLISLSEKIITDSEKWESWHKILDSSELDRETEITKTSQQKTKNINPLQLLRSLEEKLPKNSVIIVDGGDFAASAAYILRPRGPLKWLDPGVFGTLGSGGGFALGAALQYPDHYIWIIYGDGSAGYSLMEFDTFKKFGMKVCGIIGNNGSWEQIARDQVHILESNTASTLPRSDYEKVGAAFGANGVRADTQKSFDLAVHSAIESMDNGIPYLINAIIGSTDFRKGSISM